MSSSVRAEGGEGRVAREPGAEVGEDVGGARGGHDAELARGKREGDVAVRVDQRAEVRRESSVGDAAVGERRERGGGDGLTERLGARGVEGDGDGAGRGGGEERDGPLVRGGGAEQGEHAGRRGGRADGGSAARGVEGDEAGPVTMARSCPFASMVAPPSTLPPNVPMRAGSRPEAGYQA